MVERSSIKAVSHYLSGIQFAMPHQPSATPGVTKRLCSWIHALSLDDVPEDVKTRAKYLILDGLCCALVGAHLPWVEKAANAVFAMESEGECAVWGYNKVPAPSTFLYTSIDIRRVEMTDMDLRIETRPTSRYAPE